MGFLSYCITNFVNVVTAVINLTICSYSVDVISNNKNILYDLDVSANCKKVFFYNMSYCVLSGLFVLIMFPKYVCNLCKTRPTLIWSCGDWFLITLMVGTSVWGYTFYEKLPLDTYCNNIFKSQYSAVAQLVGYQLLSLCLTMGLYVLGHLMICISKKCEVKKNTSSKRSSSFIM